METNKTLNATMSSYPLTKIENELKRIRILSVFDQWIHESNFNEWHFCLYRFASEKPLSYFSFAAIDETLNMLRANQKFVPAALSAYSQEISQAIFSLLRPGSSWGKEQSLSLDTPDDFAEFESIWHPEYIRYCEQIYNHLIQIPLEILGQTRSKQYTTEALANRVEKLSIFGLGTLADGYNSAVRNSISHGHVAFGVLDITYEDKKKTEVLDAQEFGNLFDALVDTCHSVVIAALLFVCEERQEFEKAGLANLPLGIRFLFIDGFTYHKGTRILSLIENQIRGNKKQINVSYRIETKLRQVQMFESFFIGWAVSIFGGGSQYDRYVISIDCGKPSTAMVIFNGDALHQAIEKDETLVVSASKIIESSLLWYDAPKIGAYIYNLKSLIPTQWVILKDKLTRIFKGAGLKIISQDYKIVNIENISPRKLRRLEAHLILNHNGSTTPEKLFEIVSHALKQLQKVYIRVKDFEGEKGFPGHPDYIIIRLYSIEKRLRRLKAYNWSDKELILIAEWNKNWKTAPPYYTKDYADIIKNNMRIKLNKQLIKIN